MNKNLFIFTTLMWLALSATAQTGKEWDDPLKTSVNREMAHTVSLPMASETDAAKNDLTLSPY